MTRGAQAMTPSEQSDMDRASHLERGDAGGGKWPDGPVAFRWSRQSGRVKAFHYNSAHSLTLEEAEQALNELTLCVAAAQEWSRK